MMEPVLKMEHVTKRFSGLVAVNDLSLEMPENCIHSLIGPNGSGKTTTVNMITGVLPVSEGEIFYRGVKTSGSPVYRIARLGVGRTFQNLKLFGSMSVLENLMIGAHQMTKIGLVRFLVDLPGEKREEKLLTERAEQVLEEIGLADLRHEKVKNLAYGKQKMTELGRALMLKPALLILDEPAAGLNPEEVLALIDFIRLIKERFQLSILVIEHRMDLIMTLCDTIYVQDFGRTIAVGPPAKIQKDPAVLAAYLGEEEV